MVLTSPSNDLTLIVSPTSNGRWIRISTPDNRLLIESFSAKPTAKPVNPKLATIAETSIPSVPSAVTSPITISARYAELASKLITLESIPAVAPPLRTTFRATMANNQKTNRTSTAEPILGSHSAACFGRASVKYSFTGKENVQVAPSTQAPLDKPTHLGSICPCNSRPFSNANYLPLCCRLPAR